MANDITCAGTCIYENFKLQYQIVHLEFIKGKFLQIEAICYNPYAYDKEAIFKYCTRNFAISDEKFKIAISLLNSVIDNLELPSIPFRLIVKNHQVYYLYVV
jgi:hypothetical protein